MLQDNLPYTEDMLKHNLRAFGEAAGLLDDQPGPAPRRQLERKRGLELAIERAAYRLPFFATYGSHVGQAGVVEGQDERRLGLTIPWVEHEGQALGLQLRVDVEHGVEVAAVGPAHVDHVGVEDRPVLLVELRPLLDHGLGGLGVVEAPAAVAGLDAGAKVLGEVGLVGVEMLGQRLDQGARPAR